MLNVFRRFVAGTLFALCLSGPAAAVTIVGGALIAEGGEVFAVYEGVSPATAFSNDLYFVDPGGDLFLFNNFATAVGTTISLGTFAAGTELVFRLHVNDTGDDFLTGPGSRNADGEAHARLTAPYSILNGPLVGEPATLTEFEDLFGNPEGAGGFNDLFFAFTSTEPQVAPAPGTLALLAIALLGAGIAGRRKAA